MRLYSLLLSLLLVACGSPLVPESPEASGDFSSAATQTDGGTVAKSVTLTAKGLYTYPNPTSSIPNGAFAIADDAVIRRDGIAETRRGFKPATGTLGSSGARFDAMGDFSGTLVGHNSANALARYDGTTWTAYSGTYTPPSGSRMHFLQMAGSLYFTTTTGVKRLDAVDGAVYSAGVPQATGGSASVTGSSGFLPANSATAYRFVWGTRNANNRLILGAPSGRVTVANSGATSANVSVTVSIPSWVTTSYFLQVYRADSSASATLPAFDDMALAYEVYPSTTDISAASLTFTDVTPDEMLGASLYSSPNTGIPGSEKFQPPVCHDLAMYKERMWCGRTTQRQRVAITLLSVDDTSGGMVDGQGFRVDGTQYKAGSAENVGTRTFQRYTSGTAAQNVENTARSLVRIINSTSVTVNAFYVSGEYDNPGQILLEAKYLGASAFNVISIGAGSYWAPATYGTMVSTDLVRASNVVTATTIPAHGLRVGQVVNISSGAAGFPSGEKTVTATPTATTFTYAEVGANASWSGGGTGWTTDTTEPILLSDPVDAPSGIAYSEYAEPDAFPLGNYLPVGSANYDVLRIIPLGDTLFIFKEDGTYVLTGDSPETFSARAYPTPAKVVAPESAVVLGSSIYALTDQGVMAFTENGATLLSRPVEGDFTPFYSSETFSPSVLSSTAFGVAYETEREYHLFLPTTASDTYATQAYVYNYATRTWARWTLDATAGYVLPGQDKEYLGQADRNGVLVERKTRTSTDYQDADGVPISLNVKWVASFGDDPTQSTQWQKATVLFESPPPTNVTLGFSTEMAAEASGVMPTNGFGYVTSYIPPEQSRSQSLFVRTQAAEVGKKFAIIGVGINYFTGGSL